MVSVAMVGVEFNLGTCCKLLANLYDRCDTSPGRSRIESMICEIVVSSSSLYQGRNRILPCEAMAPTLKLRFLSETKNRSFGGTSKLTHRDVTSSIQLPFRHGLC